ncbi:trace amine-associated receptor 7a-like [Stylophora pistillata]|uniref:trace amine-associated receptor 7a-like n=1 Tax=Stylophora pistillata TaxID=50429 RepID=UPI000C051BAF|nr:trace amine-associated receptor 7a-like [Stylophora pistillata]
MSSFLGEPICGSNFTFRTEVCLSSTAVMSIVASATVVGNFLLLLTIYLNYRRLFRTPSTFLIANLGFSDLLVGLLVGFPVAVRDVYRYHGASLEGITEIIQVCGGLTMFVNGFSIIALSVDRYIAVSDPMRYRLRVTRKRIKIFFTLLWISSALLCCLQLTGIDKKVYVTIYLHTHATIPIFVLTAVCIKMFQALKSHRQEMQTLRNFSFLKRQEMERERKMAKTVFIILVLFYLTLLPSYITLHVVHLYRGSNFELRSIFRQVDFIATRFLFLNSAIDPFVYAWRIPKYREGFTKIVSFVRHRKKTEKISKGNDVVVTRNDEELSVQDTYL